MSSPTITVSMDAFLHSWLNNYGSSRAYLDMVQMLRTKWSMLLQCSIGGNGKDIVAYVDWNQKTSFAKAVIAGKS